VANKKASGPIDRRVGARIRRRRETIGLSQEKLARQIGITFQQIQKYEKGSNRIGSGRLQEIANALDVPISYFFADGKDEVRSDWCLHEGNSNISTTSLKEQCSQLTRDFKKIEDLRVRCSILTLTRCAARDDDGTKPNQETQNLII
jgi:transcriptional regulator with XRE-family HTH domain